MLLDILNVIKHRFTESNAYRIKRKGGCPLSNYSIAIVTDTIEVLETLRHYNEGASLAELTRTTDLSKNKIFRILYTLEEHQFVERDEQGRYRLGLRFLSFGQQVQEQQSLLRAAQPVMDQLVVETNETIFLGVLDGNEALCVDARQSPQSVRLFARVGRRAPLYAGGVPKILLAYLDPVRRKALLDSIELKPMTPHTITDRTVLEGLLDHIRQQGYVIATDDLDAGAVSVAAPIRDSTGAVVAAISVAGPATRFDEERTEKHRQLVCAAAETISRALGYSTTGNGASACTVHGRSHLAQR